MSVDVVTFGCRLNTYESEVMKAHAEKAGLANAIIFGNIGLVVQHNLFRDTLSYQPMVQTLSTMVLDGILKK